MDEVLLYFSLKYNGDFDRQYQALQNKEPVDRELFQELKSKMNSSYITILDDRYPDALKKINYPPFVIFYKGDPELMKNKSISVIGMSEPSDYGMEKAKQLSAYLSQNDITVVSGLGKGIDTLCHETCISSQAKTIAVLPCGIEYCYPAENRELYDELCRNQLVISEYPYDIPPRKDFFPKRNRIATGLGEKLLVVECNRKGGSMISVGFALEQDKEVLCVPHIMGEKDGCNYLISLGATPVLEESDLIRETENKEYEKNSILDSLSRSKRREKEF